MYIVSVIFYYHWNYSFNAFCIGKLIGNSGFRSIMLIDDIIYVAVLVLCIAFGKVFRDIKDAATKQWVATGFGVLVGFVVSGVHIVHPIICTVITALLLTNLPSRWVITRFFIHIVKEKRFFLFILLMKKHFFLFILLMKKIF